MTMNDQQLYHCMIHIKVLNAVFISRKMLGKKKMTNALEDQRIGHFKNT